MGDEASPLGPRSPYAVVDLLDRDWRERLADPGPELDAWRRHHAALADLPDLGAVERRAATGSDAVLHALLVEAQRGDQLAQRTVLQASLGRMVRMAGRDRRSTVDDYVAALWCVVVLYPLAARPVRIAANLALDTLKAVHGESRWWPRGSCEAVLPGDDLEPLLERSAQRAGLDHSAASALSAGEVIEAARRLRLIDDRASGLLHLVYVEGLTGQQAAARDSSTPGSVRVRCSRAVQKLAAHASALAEAA